MTEENQDTTQNKTQGITLFSFMGSLLAGWFGVSSQKRRERDFTHGKFSHFIIGGIIFAVLFVLMVIGIVKIVMSVAGA